MPRAPIYDDILLVADKAIHIFETYNLDCCLVGSVACALYGVDRCPNDVDIAVFTRRHAEELKGILVDHDDRFYLVPSRNRDATYEVLWYKLSNRCKCKVDILITGDLGIPHVPRTQIERRYGFPVMPLLPLLMLKLGGWSDYRRSSRADFREKQYVDVGDINELLTIARDEGTHIHSNNLSWVPEDLIRNTERYISDYSNMRRNSLIWRELGFDVE